VTATILDIHDLVKWHGPLRVLEGISLTVRRGEVAAIIGPSGGGKSTLLRCVNGLETFQAGEIRFDQFRLSSGVGRRDRAAMLRALRRRVGMVFQQFHLFPHLNVIQNVMSGPLWVLGRPRGEAETEARQLLERVGLADKLHASVEQLSGGQQQRVAIARALAMKPDAILFDEPTSALDPRMAAEVLGVITDLAKAGQTMLVVTHAMPFARHVAHTVHVMEGGHIVESGPPEQVLEAPREERTRLFLGQVQTT
jgi:ABC-type polar amino acid transport system ATPase subunit